MHVITSLERAKPVFKTRVSRQGDGLNVAYSRIRMSSDTANQIVSILARHADVTDQDIKGLVAVHGLQ